MSDIGSTDRIIKEMQWAYGITARYPTNTSLNLENELDKIRQTHGEDHPLLNTPEKSEREAQRVFRQRPIQFKAQHPVLMLISFIYQHISNRIKAFFQREDVKKKNDILFLANSLKNHGYISQKQFIQFKDAYSNGSASLKNNLKDLIKNLHLDCKLDRKSYLHLTLLAHNECTKEILQFLFALSSVSNVHRFQEELKEIVQPQEQLEMLELLKQAYQHSTFDDEAVTVFSNLTARLEIYAWLKTDLRETSQRRDLIKALKDNHSKNFQKAIIEYLTTRSNTSSNSLEKRYFTELAQSFKNPNSTNPLIHFSQALETLSVLKEWEGKVTNLETSLMDLNSLDEKEGHRILEELKELYRIFGKILDNEKEFGASPLAMGLEQGLLSEKWSNIGKRMHELLSKGSDHELCGCILDEEMKAAWPDAENTEIRASQQAHKDLEKEKKNVLFFYCNWGSGHRSVTQGHADYLLEDEEREYHVSAIDLPQTALFSTDPVNQFAGGDNSIATMFNSLLAGRHFNWINKIASLSKGEPAPDTVDQIRARIREQMLKKRPDIVVVNYGTHGGYILDVAQELGIPTLRVMTDLDVRMDELDDHPHTVPHFKKAIPYDVPEIMDYLRSYYTDEQIEVMGYTIRPQFLKLQEQIKNDPQVLLKLKEKHGVKDDEIVYIVSGGGCGTDSPWAQMLASTKPGEIPKGHVFAIAGRNKEFKTELDSFLTENANKLNPEINLHVKGFLDAQEMAELEALAAATNGPGSRCGLHAGKGGGGTTAEAMLMGAQMLIDMRGGDGFRWEKYAGAEIHKRNMGACVTNKKDFIRLVNERTSKVNVDHSFFTKHHPQTRFVEILNGMIEKAENDPAFMLKRTAWKTNTAFMKGVAPKGDVLNYFDSVSSLNQMLKTMKQETELQIDSDMAKWLVAKKPCLIDFSQMKLIPAKKYNQADARLSIRYFINRLEDALSNPEGDKEKLLFMASHYLDLVRDKHSKQLKDGLKKCKKNPFLMEIAYLDRLIVSANLKAHQIDADSFKQRFGLDKPDQNPYQSIDLLYKTPLAKEQLKNWVEEKTHRSRNKSIDDPIFERSSAFLSFVLHPDQYNWLIDLGIQKSAATFNHHLEVNAQGEVMILFEGEKSSVSKLINSSLTSIGKRIVNPATGAEFVYDYEKGLKEVSSLESHPDYWKNELPLFKRKERHTSDYRLEIITDTDSNNDLTDFQHAWIRLKTPDGDIYSVGRSWDPDIAFPLLEKTELFPSHLRAGDPHEFKNGKKRQNLKVTKLDLGSLENFNKVKKYIEKLQSEGDGFNIINRNCVSLVNDVCNLLDIEVQSKMGLTELTLPIPLFMRKFFLMNSWMRDVSIVLFYPMTLISHFVLGVFGGFKRHLMTSPQKKALFHSMTSFFHPSSSLIDSPSQLRVWQECLHSDLGNKVLSLDDVRQFTRKISRIKLKSVI